MNLGLSDVLKAFTLVQEAHTEKYGYRFSFGPWNIHEGADLFGPTVRPIRSFTEKLGVYRELGFDEVQFVDVKALRTQPKHLATKHLRNSLWTFLRLVELSRSLDRQQVEKLIAERDYEELDWLILNHLMQGSGA